MNPIITITPNDDNTYNIDYQLNEIELNGTASPYNTGRCIEYNFEISYFNSDEDEEYYDDNYEDIEVQVLSELDTYLSNQNGK